MAVGTFLVSLFALVGLVALTGLLLYYLAKWIKTWKKAQTPKYPSDNYMRAVGSRCPDYWVYKGQQMGTDKDGKSVLMGVCENKFGVEVPSDTCYSDAGAKTKNFSVVNWDTFGQSSYGNSDRCNFVRQCGPNNIANSTSNSWADWTGIAENC